MSLKSQSTSSYLINQSHNGAPVSTFIGEVYEFQSWSPCRLPNVIIIETAMNSQFGWQTAKYLENLIFLLQEKWLSKDIREPNFFFLELFKQYRPYGSSIHREKITRKQSCALKFFRRIEPEVQPRMSRGAFHQCACPLQHCTLYGHLFFGSSSRIRSTTATATSAKRIELCGRIHMTEFISAARDTPPWEMRSSFLSSSVS